MLDDQNPPRLEPDLVDRFRGKIVTLGSEKGGTSKSTTALHLFACLAAHGLRVGVIDLDARQRSTDQALENRDRTKAARGLDLVRPMRATVPLSRNLDERLRRREDTGAFRRTVLEMLEQVDVILVDCPGAQTTLSHIGHVSADLLVTPMGPSAIEAAVLAQFSASDGAYVGKSAYSEAVFEAATARRNRDAGELVWRLAFNRYSAARPATDDPFWRTFETLGRKLGFEPVVGLAFRRVYSELYPYGLTAFDLSPADGDDRAAEIAAAQREVEALVASLAAALPQPVAK